MRCGAHAGALPPLRAACVMAAVTPKLLLLCAGALGVKTYIKCPNSPEREREEERRERERGERESQREGRGDGGVVTLNPVDI